MPDTAHRATHDLGGALPWAAQPIDREEHPFTPFDKRVDAMLYLLLRRKLMTVDELRRAIESLPEAEYHALSYYEKWLRAMRLLMIEKKVVDAGELERRTARLLGARA
jgi:nitrile hydratase